MNETIDKKVETRNRKKDVLPDDIAVTQEQNNASHKRLDLDAEVTVRNIACWRTGFAQKTNKYAYGDISITPKGTVQLSIREIIAQIQSENKLLTGIDGKGSHATLVIDDAATRIEVGFEGEGFKQKVFSDELIKRLFDIGLIEQFEAQLKDSIVTRSEKYAAIDAMRRLKVNDYAKIRIVEEYTGYKL